MAKNKQQPLDTGMRMRVVIACLLGLAALCLWRIASHQVLSGGQGYRFLQAQGNARSVRMESIAANRGMITDRNGEPLAVSTPVVTLWAKPVELGAQQDRWPALAGALGITEKELRERLQANAGKQFLYLRRQLPPDEAQKILDLDIQGVYGEREYKRYYPAGDVAAHIVGFTNIDEHGQEGLELAYEEVLRGVPGKKQVVKDLKGRVIKDLQLVERERPGKDIQLSIDLRLQYLAMRELERAIEEHQAKAGSVVILDTVTGEVLAMVNYPTYNPNNRRHVTTNAMRNRAVTDVFEPGSSVKPLTIAAALESGKYTPDSRINTNPGQLMVGDKLLKDMHNYGELTLTQVITKSSQIGTVKVALSLNAEDVRSVFSRAGIGQPTGSGFPGESTGYLPNHRKWLDIERATLAFGHGLSLTPLQLAEAYTMFAADGQRKQVSLLKTSQPAFSETALKPEVAHQVLAMMQTVTGPGGTGTRAAVPAFTVAGKTGTIYKLSATGRGYADNNYIAVFAGIAPATNPRLIGVVMIDEPSPKKHFGGEVAAPVFGRVMSGSLRLMSVPPDNIKVEIPKQAGDLS